MAKRQTKVPFVVSGQDDPRFDASVAFARARLDFSNRRERRTVSPVANAIFASANHAHSRGYAARSPVALRRPKVAAGDASDRRLLSYSFRHRAPAPRRFPRASRAFARAHSGTQRFTTLGSLRRAVRPARGAKTPRLPLVENDRASDTSVAFSMRKPRSIPTWAP